MALRHIDLTQMKPMDTPPASATGGSNIYYAIYCIYKYKSYTVQLDTPVDTPKIYRFIRMFSVRVGHSFL